MISGITRFVIIFSVLIVLNNTFPSGSEEEMDYRKLTPEEERVILNGGTEAPFTGEYVDHSENGIYLCRQCGAELYTSDSKFSSHCGWPSFDAEIEGAVERRPDPDGIRTEILCKACGAHLGHVFTGEGYTSADTRHCVNSISMMFQPVMTEETAIFAGGCFWGLEHLFMQQDGVLKTEAGYTGGNLNEPSYQDVCSGTTGHAEAVRIVFDPSLVSYEELVKMFFEIHDPTQVNRQGADTGTQYRSVVFYTSEEQKITSERLVAFLNDRGYRVVTDIEPASAFWPAEDYHQQYYEKNSIDSHCTLRVRRFND